MLGYALKWTPHSDVTSRDYIKILVLLLFSDWQTVLFQVGSLSCRVTGCWLSLLDSRLCPSYCELPQGRMGAG